MRKWTHGSLKAMSQTSHSSNKTGGAYPPTPSGVIERKIGYSNAMMLEDIRMAYKVLTQGEDVYKLSRAGVKKGEPSKRVFVERRPKFDVPKEILERHINSIKYYQKDDRNKLFHND